MAWCKFTSCLNVFNSGSYEKFADTPCQACSTQFYTSIAQLPVGVNTVPLGYLIAAVRNDPSSINFTSVEDVETVIRDAKATVGKSYSGEWWRGNELGGIVNNPDFWSGTGVYPMSNMIGATPKQHSAIRKAFEKAFAPPKDSAWIRESLKEFLKERTTAASLAVKGDIKAWMYQVGYKNVFNKSVDWATAVEFGKCQSNLVSMGTISQGISGNFYYLFGGMMGISGAKECATKHVHEYLPLVEEIWGKELGKYDCSPTPNCSLQLASGLWDAFYSAGGLSVPTIIQSGLALLYSTHTSNPAPGYTIPPGKELDFFWECLRFIPPVYGFPHWEDSRPVCVGLTAEETQALNQTGSENNVACPKAPVNWQTGFPTVNQWYGGNRYVLSLEKVQKSPERWGAGADTTFFVRPLEEYESKSVGFAEPAVDDTVDDGRSNRVCPGKDLALLIGKIFFEEFDTGAWQATDPAIGIYPDASLVQISEFYLQPAGFAGR